MPVARVRSKAETHIPRELLRQKIVPWKNEHIYQDVTDALTPDQRRIRRLQAANFVQHLRTKLGLDKRQRLESITIENYHERDIAKVEIAGAMVVRPVVSGPDGTRRELPTIWFDKQRRHPDYFTQTDINFAGRVALQNDALYGGYVVDRLSESATTPRDEMISQELAKVTSIGSAPQQPPRPFESGQKVA